MFRNMRSIEYEEFYLMNRAFQTLRSVHIYLPSKHDNMDLKYIGYNWLASPYLPAVTYIQSTKIKNGNIFAFEI